ncbi:MAG: hypothetical protein RLZZ90_300 [Actinomycetota bacterium]|jgi:hypothetical protein
MNFDPLFEDLEARFIAAESNTNDGFSTGAIHRATSIELLLLTGQRQTLISPVLGQGFAAGVHPVSPNWLVVPAGAIRSIGFEFETNFGLPTLQFSEANFQEHLGQLPFPAKCNFRTLNPDEGLMHSTLLGVSQGLVFMHRDDGQSFRAIPLEQVTCLQIWAVDNLSRDL